MDAIEKIKDFWPEWTIEGPLGRGSYGKVYSASRSDAGKKYYSAIKVMTIPSGEEEIEQVRAEGLDEQSTREYFREIVQGCIQEITMMMDYRGTANIVNVEDYKVIEHTDSIGWDIFIRMEKLLCLKEIMKKRTLTEEETVNLGINISTALIDCEMDDVIHRDIKPANIFLHPKTGVYKLGECPVRGRTTIWPRRSLPQIHMIRLSISMRSDLSCTGYAMKTRVLLSTSAAGHFGRQMRNARMACVSPG